MSELYNSLLTEIETKELIEKEIKNMKNLQKI